MTLNLLILFEKDKNTLVLILIVIKKNYDEIYDLSFLEQYKLE